MDKYSIRYIPYERYGETSEHRATFQAATLADAWRKVADELSLYIESEEIINDESERTEEVSESRCIHEDDLMTPEQVLENVESSNGDGCDFITYFANETTGQVILDEEIEDDVEDWDD